MAKITIPVSTIYQLVLRMESHYAYRIAIRYYDEALEGVREIPYRQYAHDIRCVTAALQAAVPDIEGKRVCVLAANSYDYAVSIFATILTGAVLVPLNLQKSWEDIRYELDLVEASAVLHDGRYLEREPGIGGAYGDRMLPIDGYKEYPPAAIHECKDREALMAIMFTSGTTGHSKGVMLSQRNLFAPMRLFTEPFGTVRQQFGLGEDYQFSAFNVLPLFHVAALTSLISWSISGNAVNFCTDLRRFYRDLAAMPSDVMAVVPTLLKSIHHDVAKGKGARLGKLRIFTCGAATYDPQMLADLTGAEVVHHTRGGARLSEQLNPSTRLGSQTQAALQKEKWDYVVLQEMSHGPITAPKSFFSSVEQLCRQIRANGAVPILFATWAYQRGGAKLTDKGWDYDEMAQKLSEAYHKAALENNALIADVGRRFYEWSDPQDLYAADGVHPSELGSHIAAETIAAVIRQHEKEAQ